MSRETLSATSPTVAILLRIPADERERAKRMARRERVPLAHWLREAIRARFKKPAQDA